MMSINEIMRAIVGRVSDKLGYHVEFQFGDWDYIADVLQVMSTSNTTSHLRYPIVCLRSPYTEQREGKTRTATLEMLIAVNTLKDYTNEQREETSFKEILRPIYDSLILEISKDKAVKSNYAGKPNHSYTENYRYGRRGVEGGDGNKFKDYIDAIEIQNLSLTFKDLNCYEV